MTYTAALRLMIGLRNAICRNTSSGSSRFAPQSINDETSRSIPSHLLPCHFVCAVIFALALGIAPQGAFAQHGGGGGHAGGGGHIGGGGGHVSSVPSVSSSSHPSSTRPASSSSSSSSARPAASRSSSVMGSSGRASTMSGTSSRSSGGLSTTSGAAFAAPRNVTIGFPPRAIGESGAGSASASGPLASGGHLSFYGDGGAVWAEPTASGKSVARLAPGDGRAKATPSTSRAEIVITSSPTGGGAGDAPLHPHRPISNSSPTFSGGRNFGLFGGFFLGFDWDTSATSGCDPTWSFGCDALGDRIGSDVVGYDADAGAGDGSYSGDDSAAEVPSVDEDQVTNTWVDPPAPAAHAPQGVAVEKSGAVLCLKNGSVYAVTNYWVAGGKVHYETSYGGGNSVELGELDFQRSVDANAARGVDFTLRPAPATQPKADETQQPD
jgi:hypothetical protein